MANFNATVTLGKDPELKKSNDGRTTYAKFSAAWSERVKDQNQQFTDGPTVWLHCTAFGRVAQNLAASLHKGDRVNIVGRMTPETWTDRQTGQASTVFTVSADSVSPDLTFASVQVQKNPKQGGGYGGGQQQGGFGGQQGGADPWNSAPQGNGFGSTEQPPF